MGFYLIIVCYRLYFWGIALLVVNTVARYVFKEVKFRNGLRAIFAALFWPLFIFSQRGRKKLLGKINKL